MNDSSDQQSIEELRKSIVYLRAKNKILLECLEKYDKWRDEIIQSTNLFFDVSLVDENYDVDVEENKFKMEKNEQ